MATRTKVRVYRSTVNPARIQMNSTPASGSEADLERNAQSIIHFQVGRKSTQTCRSSRRVTPRCSFLEADIRRRCIVSRATNSNIADVSVVRYWR